MAGEVVAAVEAVAEVMVAAEAAVAIAEVAAAMAAAVDTMAAADGTAVVFMAEWRAERMAPGRIWQAPVEITPAGRTAQGLAPAAPRTPTMPTISI